MVFYERFKTMLASYNLTVSSIDPNFKRDDKILTKLKILGTYDYFRLEAKQNKIILMRTDEVTLVICLVQV
jgi:hypothetical protein